MLPVDKSRYGPAAFKANKTPQANSLRFCYELRSLLYLEDCSKPSPSFFKYLDRLQQILLADKSTAVRAEIADVFAGDGLAMVVIRGLQQLDFETGKKLLAMLTALVSASPRLQASLLAAGEECMSVLLSGYTDLKLYIICGQFFRELLQFPALFQRALTISTLRSLGLYSKSPQFEVSADAFESFKILLSTEFDFLPDFLAANYAEIDRILEDLRKTDNYFLKRQTLALTVRLLEQERNAQFRQLYASEPEHTKSAMTALKSDSSRQVKVESFFVFAAIVDLQLQQSLEAQQQSGCLKIIRKNKDRLVSFLQEFGQDVEDEKLHGVKRRLLEGLRVL